MDVNVLIEQGKARIMAREVAAYSERVKRESEQKAMLNAELDKFVYEAVEPIRAMCSDIEIGDVGEINEYKWEKQVDLAAPLCVTVEAGFVLERPYANCPRDRCTWKLRRYLIPQVELGKGADVYDEPWSVRASFWPRGYLEATETAELDEALALARERFIELTSLEQEAEKRNAAHKAELEERERAEQVRATMELDAFRPFDYYRVTYGIVANEDGERYADTNHFDSLQDAPGADGYWLEARGREIRVAHVVKVERVHVAEAGDMPGWCPTVETEFGTVRVPPQVLLLQ